MVEMESMSFFVSPPHLCDHRVKLKNRIVKNDQPRAVHSKSSPPKSVDASVPSLGYGAGLGTAWLRVFFFPSPYVRGRIYPVT